ncbi:hypothetical protein ACFLUA_00840 [Chloroflexota bacterium]
MKCIVAHLVVIYRKNNVNHAYLLRCWQEGKATPDGKSQWRFSMQEILHERRCWGFTNLVELVTFLQAELDLVENQTSDDIRD